MDPLDGVFDLGAPGITEQVLQGDGWVVVAEQWVRKFNLDYVAKPLSKIPYLSLTRALSALLFAELFRIVLNDDVLILKTRNDA